MQNKYVDRHLKDQAQRDEIWKRIKSDDDVFNMIDTLKGMVVYMSNRLSNKLGREDIDYLEMALAEFELTIQKIDKASYLFSFSESDIWNIISKYQDLTRKVKTMHNLKRGMLNEKLVCYTI